MTVRKTVFFAYSLALATSCGDAQLNESRREFYPVTLSEWHSRYAPGITAVVPFPGLAEASTPRFTSSDPTVAQVSVFRQSIDEPRFRALRMATGATGDSDISLYDGDRLVRTETVNVYEADSFNFDIKVQNEVAPPAAALGPDERVGFLENAPVPAVLRFYRNDDEVIAAGVPSPSFPARDVWIRSLYRGVDTPAISEDGIYGTSDQLSSGDWVEVTAIDDPDLYIDLPSGGSITDGPYDQFERARFIDSLEIIASSTRVENRASIAVFGVSNGVRVVGLDPEVTLDGEVLDHCEYEDCTGENPLPFALKWRWLFPLPDGVSAGTIEAKWRGLEASVELGEGG